MNSVIQWKLCNGKYPDTLKHFMSTMPRHTFSKLFQPRTSRGVQGNYFQMRYISKRNHYYKYSQLEEVSTAKEMFFASCRARLIE